MNKGCFKQASKYPRELCNTRFYNIWCDMKKRCLNPKTKNYCNYGGRGITICKKWLTFGGFYKDLYKSYSELKGDENELTLDRINNNKGYSKSNCRWATYLEQGNNKRNSHFITYQGRKQTLSQWARELKFNRLTLRRRIKNAGWSVEKAFTTPLIPNSKERFRG